MGDIIFTGIIEEIGEINKINRGSNSFQLYISAQKVVSDVSTGDSICVNGVCLTVIEFGKNYFAADVMPETVEKTTLKNLKSGQRVNLERALRLEDRMGGHIVQGHVDGVGTILQKETLDIAVIYKIQAPANVLKYTVPKGSIAIDGISLTVIDVYSDSFTVSLIPHTAQLTILGSKKSGDQVNLETDIIGRYIEKFLKAGDEKKESKLNMGFLTEHGFI